MSDLAAVPGLSGEEIIQDTCDQLAHKLRNDCNLRAADSYVGGYSAKISYEIYCYGLDTATVKGEYTLGVPKTEDPSTTLKDTVEIANEPDLSEVRERAGLPEPSTETEQQTTTPEKSKPRRYGRASTVAAGGNEEPLSE